jgi:hypothetical protein
MTSPTPRQRLLWARDFARLEAIACRARGALRDERKWLDLLHLLGDPR